MIIGIDASRAGKKYKTGTEWYSYHLISYLSKIDKTNEYWLYTRKDAFDLPLNLSTNFYVKILSWPVKYIWTHLRLSWEMLINPPDILFVPAHSVPLFHRSRCVVTIHDLGFLHNPEIYQTLARFYHRFSAWWSIKFAKRIITISQFTKNDILNRFNVSSDKIAVMPLGFDKSKYRIIQDKSLLTQIKEKYNFNKPFFFYIGRLEKKKNIKLLVAAFELFLSHNPDFNLVLAGCLGFGGDDILKAIHHNDKIKYLEYIAEEDVPVILNLARAFIFPSLFEGFGLPVIQAMACGCPVICSNTTSLPEIGGQAAWYFEPDNKSELVALLKRINVDFAARQTLVNQGLKHAEQFDWLKVAEKTLKFLVS